jgi:DNA-binding NarL/FixJ family response regulator
MTGPARLLVTDDDPLVRDAYRSFFAHREDFVICGEARDGAEGVAAYAAQRPDVVLMDLQMPVLSGLDAIHRICTDDPAACVVAMTTFSTSAYVVAALRAGASGYLLKDVGGPGLIAGLTQALAGEMPLSGAVRRELVSELVEKPAPVTVVPSSLTVTPRERELLRWLAQGLTNAEIGAQMFVSEGTVKQYLLQIGRKFGLKSRTGILIRSVQLGLVDPHALPPVRD